MYFFDDYLREVLTKKTNDYVAVSHAGHGVNSYAINYHLVDGPLAVFAQVGWGGVYSDPVASGARVKELFDRIAKLISASHKAKARGLTGPPGRLVVIESDLRREFAWGWVDRPLRGAVVRDWVHRHAASESANSTQSDGPTVPTIAALKWLDTAP